MHFTKARQVRAAVEMGELRGEAAAMALDRLAYLEPEGLGLADFDARRWREYLSAEGPHEASQHMLDIMIDDATLRKGEFVLGPRALAAGVLRIVASLNPFIRLTPGRRFLSRAQAEAIAAAVLLELGVDRLEGRNRRTGMAESAGSGLSAPDPEDQAVARALAAEGGLSRLPARASGAASPAATAAASAGPPRTEHWRPRRSDPGASGGPTFHLLPSILSAHKPMPLALRATLAAVAASGRTAAAALGFREARVTTSWGRWHFFVAGPEPEREPSPATGAAAAAAPPAPPPARPTPVVVVHGMFTTSASMLALAAALAHALPDRLVIVPDLLGFDFSYSRTSRHRDMPSWVEQVGALAAALTALHRAGYRSSPVAPEPGAAPAPAASPAAFDWVGHSFGGWVSEEAAVRFPGLVRRLVLLCPGGHGRYRRYRSEVLVTGGGTPVRSVLSRVVPSVALPLASQMMLSVAQSSGVVRQLVSMGSADFFHRPAVPIPQEALLLWGSHDDLHCPFWSRAEDGLAPDVPAGRGPSEPGSQRRDAAAIDVSRPGRPGLALPDAAGEALPCPRHMLRDLARARGFWIERANHAINVEAAHTAAFLAARFLHGGLAALPDEASSVRMTVDGRLGLAAPGASRGVRGGGLRALACEAMRLGTSAVFRPMRGPSETDEIASAAGTRASKL